jgi:hypothetical protein
MEGDAEWGHGQEWPDRGKAGGRRTDRKHTGNLSRCAGAGDGDPEAPVTRRRELDHGRLEQPVGSGDGGGDPASDCTGRMQLDLDPCIEESFPTHSVLDENADVSRTRRQRFGSRKDSHGEGACISMESHPPAIGSGRGRAQHGEGRAEESPSHQCTIPRIGIGWR